VEQALAMQVPDDELKRWPLKIILDTLTNTTQIY